MADTEPRKDAPLLVAQRAYDLARDLVPAIHRFAREFRFTLGERLEGTLLDVVLPLRRARLRCPRLPA